MLYTLTVTCLKGCMSQSLHGLKVAYPKCYNPNACMYQSLHALKVACPKSYMP